MVSKFISTLKNLGGVAWILIFFLSCAIEKKSKMPSALLWEITGGNLQQPSYVFGTMHINEPSVFKFSASFENAFIHTNIFAMEVLLDENRFEDIFTWTVNDNDYSIYDYIDNQTYIKLNNQLRKTTGFQLKYFERIKPIFIYFLLQQPPPQPNNGLLLDLHLAEKAKMQNKKIEGLESFSSQINALNAIPIPQQWEWVKESLEPNNKTAKDLKKLIKLYKNENLYALEKNINATITDSLIYQKLIVERNERMAQKIIQLIQEQASFIAVGAGHLAGKTGILNQLKDAGYFLRPVPAY